MENEKQVEDLFRKQLVTWELAKRNYTGLSSALYREIYLDGFRLKLQFNPDRVRSSAAKTDELSIRERPCFLCPQNRPQEQKELSFLSDYELLVNPFPVFPRHLTIPDRRHTDQLIRDRIGDMLHLAEGLPGFFIFYNGPKCGASAPDHFHFQAGIKGELPLEKELVSFDRKLLIYEMPEGKLFSMENYLRKTLIYESTDLQWLSRKFEELLSVLQSMQPKEKEPLINLWISYKNGTWQLVVFPRIKHRPSQFFDSGEKQVLFSPGTVDFAGMLILPRKEDFEKLDSGIIMDMFGQLTCSEDVWAEIVEKLRIKN